MVSPDDLGEIVERIAQGRETGGDRDLLQQLLQGTQGQNVVQLGKFTVNLGQGRDIHVGDRIYQGTDADTIKAALQALLQAQSTPKTTLTPQEYRNRQALLSKVKNFWVKGVLETSLHHQVVMQLGLEDRSNGVAAPWNLGLAAVEQTQTALPEKTRVIDLFDQLGIGRTLLILGEPGAGKTITLLQVARELVARAEQDVARLIPVVFNLSTWRSQLSIADWLVAELNTKYQVPKAIAQPWVQQQQLLLLLDGLDEVRADYREACVIALNQFQQTHGTEMVVCSRIKDYEALSQRLALQQAVYVRSLQPAQIDQYLSDLNGDLAGLRQLLEADGALQDLARSPLMLNIMVLAYEGISPEDLPQMGVEAHRQRVFNTYIDRMLRRRGANQRYSPEQTVRWLSWLAQQLVASSQTIFLIEWLDRGWLQMAWQRWLYIALSSLIVGLAFGLVIALSVGFGPNWRLIGLMVWGLYTLPNMLMAWITLRIEQMQPSPRQGFLQRLIGSLWTALLGGELFGIVAGIARTPQVGWSVALWTVLVVGILDWQLGGIVGLSFLKPIEALRWSWKSVRQYLIMGLIGSAPLGWLLGGAGVLGQSRIEGMLFAMFGGAVFGLLTGLRAGTEIETRTTPNQGIWRSAKTSAIVALTVSTSFALVIHLLDQWLLISPDWGVFYGLFIGLLMGGPACIVHFSVRTVFYLGNAIPWNYARFLDYGVDRIFLQKVGGGYIFIHRSLMEHFAGMAKWPH
ncbi:MAG: NACHT domain-containing protein [Cyanobacteria bacterium P01_A01_bin.123]